MSDINENKVMEEVETTPFTTSNVAWGKEDTHCLVQLWDDKSIQRMLCDKETSFQAYEVISDNMRLRGFTRDARSCFDRIQFLKGAYEAYKNALVNAKKDGKSTNLLPPLCIEPHMSVLMRLLEPPAETSPKVITKFHSSSSSIMKSQIKATHFGFCFHPKFDTGSWSIAVAFACLVIFSGFFFVTLSYSAPKCACPQIWEQLDVLPTTFKVIYVCILLYLAGISTSCILVIYGTFKAQHKVLPPYIILMIFTEIGTFIASVLIFVQFSKIEEYLLFDNQTYWNMAKMVLKEDLVKSLEDMMTIMDNLLRTLLHMNTDQSLNLDSLMDAALKEGVLVVLGGMKRMMKVSAIMIFVGVNIFFITSILIVGSHYRRLKEGILRTYTGVPDLVIHKAVLTNSARSTASESLSDWSGVPLKSMKRMKSKDYSSSSRSSKRCYELERLDVEEKFPKGDIL